MSAIESNLARKKRIADSLFLSSSLASSCSCGKAVRSLLLLMMLMAV